MRSLDPEELKERLDSGATPVLIDVREPWEFEICRIEGSENIPMADVPAKLDQLERGSEFVIICHHGARSQEVATYMESLGFENVANLDGGVNAWAMAVDDDMPQY